MNIEDLVARNKGPLIAIGGAGGGLVVLVVISAIVNMPEDINLGMIMVNLIWLIFFGLLLAAGFLYLRERLDFEYLETEEDLEEVIIERPGNGASGTSTPVAHQPSPVETLEKIALRIPLGEKLEALFGITDMDQITGSVKAMYTELSELRTSADSSVSDPDQSVKLGELRDMITKLTSGLEKAQTVSARWEAKAINSTQKIEQLRQEIKEHGKWEVVDEKQLATFFPTVNLGDGEDPFLASSRRQRRLMQRLSAEGYSIVRKTN